jgi:glycosyltransferase involved in cell wall biosynthesis
MRLCSPHCGVAPETTSGGETYERELLSRLGRAGVAVDVILARRKPYPADAPNWTVHRFAIGRGLRWWVAPAVVPSAIARVFREAPFDMLRVHSLRYIGPSALWARRRHRLDVPIVAHHHHLDPSPLNRTIEKRVVDRVDHVVVGSEFARRQLASELGARVDHVSVIPYGVDARFAPRPPRADLRQRYDLGTGTIVLYFGGLKPRKNLPLLLEMWAGVVAGRPSARLLVAGGGAMLDALRARATALGVADSVRFTGYVAEAEKAAHFNLADVFVFPSAMEGFGLTVAEAMASGLAMVVSDRGSIPELVADGEGGFVRDPSRPASFAEALQRLLDDGTLRAKFAGANVERAERMFRWETCVARTRQVYESVVAGWRRKGRPSWIR